MFNHIHVNACPNTSIFIRKSKFVNNVMFCMNTTIKETVRTCVNLETSKPPFHMSLYTRYLVDLDYQGDPAWECLVLQKDWLLKLMTTCQEDHKSKGKYF